MLSVERQTPQHRDLYPTLYDMWVLLSPPTEGLWSGPTVEPPYPRRHGGLTICIVRAKAAPSIR